MEKETQQKQQQHKPPVGQVAYRSPPPAPSQQQQRQQQQPPPSHPPRHSPPLPYYGPPPGHYPHHPYYPPPPTHHRPSVQQQQQQQQQQRPSITTNTTATNYNNTKAPAKPPTKNAPANKKRSANNDDIIAPELGGVYAPILRAQYKRKVDNAAIVPLPRRVIGGLRDQLAMESNSNSCSCSKTGCLKLYCECFTAGIHCNAHCSCTACQNDGEPQNEVRRGKAIVDFLEKNPNTFRQAPTRNVEAVIRRGREEMGAAPTANAAAAAAAAVAAAEAQQQSQQSHCKCIMSRCLKKYCDCFRGGNYCQRKCVCVDCHNVKGNKEREATAQRLGVNRHKTPVQPSKQPAAASAATLNSNRPAAVAAAGAGTGMAKNDNAPINSTGVIPMMLPGGVPSVSLGFVRAGVPAKKRKLPSEEEFTTAMVRVVGGGSFEASTAEAAAMARRRADLEAQQRDRELKAKVANQSQAIREREQHQKWAVEAQDVMGTFQAMRQELLERKRDAGLLHGDITLSREYSYYDIVGSAQLASIELDLADVMASLREAEERAKKLIEREKKQSNGSSIRNAEDVDTAEESLLCTEDDSEVIGEGVPEETKVATSGPKSSNPEREAAILQTAQDAAVIRELARIIRRQAKEVKASSSF